MDQATSLSTTKGNNQGYGNRPQYQGQQQPTSNQASVHKYKKPQHNQYNR